MAEKSYDLIIIGAGPAGLTAAIRAAERGKKVVILEKNHVPGKKLLMCGNGRCNITNAESDPQLFVSNYMKNPRFMLSMLNNYSNLEVMQFYEKRGIALKLEPGLRVFPKSNKARDVLDALLKRMGEVGAEIVYASTVIDIMSQNGRVTGVKTLNGDYYSPSVLIATGGKTHQKTGSTGDGYKFAEKFGHVIIPPIKALYPFEIENNEICGLMAGLTIEAGVTFRNNSGVLHKDRGSILFAEFGISGPLMINASLYVSKSQMSGLTIDVDYLPDIDEQEADCVLVKNLRDNPNRTAENALKEMMPGTLVSAVIKTSGVDASKKANQLTSAERKEILNKIKRMEFRVSKYVNINKSVATDGGIDLKEVDNRTLESKLVKGLYFAGEVLDVIGKTGGFNLQVAWSTGWTVGDKVES